MTVWIQNPFDSLPHEGYRRQRYWLMAEAFAAMGNRVTYFTSDFSHALKARRQMRVEVESSVKLVLVPTRGYRRNVSMVRVLSHRDYARRWEKLALGAANERPDLIISSFPTISASECALRLARRFGAKAVVDIQDAWPETFERLVPRWARGFARLAFLPLRLRARQIFRDADFITGTCESYRRLSGRADYYRAYLGIARTQGEGVATKRGERSGVRLAYVGNLGRSYDLDTIQRAVKANDDFTLDVAGFGEFRASSDRVRFHGMLAADELEAMLCGCDVGVVPMDDSACVALPNKVFDYVAAGLGIVSSLGGELAELVDRARIGATYAAGDAESFVVAARRAAGMAGDAPRKLADGEFAAERIYADYAARMIELVATTPKEER